MQLTVQAEKRKNTWRFRLPAAPTSIAHQSPSPPPHLRSLQPLRPTGCIVLQKMGEAGGKVEEMKGKGRIAACEQRWSAAGRGQKQRLSSRPQGRRRTADFLPPFGTTSCLSPGEALVLSPGAADKRPPVAADATLADWPHAQTCLMWKLTTYSALVRWTEMAKGSKGWKVKATRRLTAWFTGRPKRPA